MIDRQYLAAWSLDLDDAGFAQALAAAGVWTAARPGEPLAAPAGSERAPAASAASIVDLLAAAGEQ